MNAEFRKMKFSELFKQLETGKVFEVKIEDIPFDDSKKIKMINDILHFKEDDKYYPLELPLSDFQTFYFREVKTIKDQIKEIIKTNDFILYEISEKKITIFENLSPKELDIITFENDYYYIETKTNTITYSYPIGFLDKLHEIFKNNGYSFKEEF